MTAVEERVVFGELAEGERVSTSYLERYNTTDRHRNARKRRKTYRFSKNWDVHEAMTCFATFSYNFCWPIRTLRLQDNRGRWRQRTPAMVAGLEVVSKPPVGADVHLLSLGFSQANPRRRGFEMAS